MFFEKLANDVWISFLRSYFVLGPVKEKDPVKMDGDKELPKEEEEKKEDEVKMEEEEETVDDIKEKEVQKVITKSLISKHCSQ